ncbi:hypothetical protein HPP92_014627 [Vanilla planifolia]|uniref:Uncharacterized protein n=1 Tax=Vanilla planifolia TaxID=51239 RepID=A0A835QLW0_VANPL|nr:hypothetical protein HPP92_014627 [Vanilla planifolia]
MDFYSDMEVERGSVAVSIRTGGTQSTIVGDQEGRGTETERESSLRQLRRPLANVISAIWTICYSTFVIAPSQEPLPASHLLPSLFRTHY